MAGASVTLLFSGGGKTPERSCALRRRKKAYRISHPADPVVCAPGVSVL
ncbi:MAG: hypothetical protein J6S98_02390 [Lentisphaeria bacterium]|nr:hypothetical protein [Lentisphaeria bacterium]